MLQAACDSGFLDVFLRGDDGPGVNGVISEFRSEWCTRRTMLKMDPRLPRQRGDDSGDDGVDMKHDAPIG